MKKIILLIETSWAYGRGLLRGISMYSRTNGLWVVHREHRTLEIGISELVKMDADGMIVRGSPNPMLGQLLAKGIPAIVLHYNKDYRGIPVVRTNNNSISKLAASHLLDRGLHQFAFCGLDDMQWSRERGTAFLNEIREMKKDCFLFEQSSSSEQRIWKNESPLLVDWLKSLPKPIGIMACNDERATDIMEACKLADILVPEQVALIGVDDDEFICDLTNPTLTSVSLNTDRAGFEAASLLNAMMTGKTTGTSEIVVEATHIAMRQSTNILAVDDSDVATALRYIRNHSRSPLQVSDVVDAMMISRRSLQQKFTHSLGHTIYDEIRKSRSEQIAEMLINTSLPISRIAHELGFPGVEHVSRYFKQSKGLSPQAYRKKNGRFL